MKMYLRPLVLLALGAMSFAVAAGTDSEAVPINATVLNSCEFYSEVMAVIDIPDYEAADDTPSSGSTTLTVLCNSETAPIADYWEAEPNLEVGLSDGTAPDFLVTLGYGTISGPSFDEGSGGDLFTYEVTATPVANQWNVPSGDYTGTQNYWIGF